MKANLRGDVAQEEYYISVVINNLGQKGVNIKNNNKNTFLNQ